MEAQVFGPVLENVYVLPESAFRESGRVWTVQDGILDELRPRTLGRVDSGWVTEAFDAGQGVVDGTVPGVRKGMAVAVSDADNSG